MADDEPSFDITRISIYYSVAASSTLVLEAAIVRLLRRGRPKLHGDGLFVLHGWGILARAAVVCFLMIFAMLPVLVFVTALVAGAVLSAIENWTFSDGFEYVICNILGIGPIIVLTPTSIGGKIADMIISCWAMLLGTTFLGLSASLSLTLQWLGTIKPTTLGLIRCLLLYIPALMAVLSLICGSMLAYIEGWSVGDGFLFMVGSLCQIEDPLTQAAPNTDTGNFFMCLCFLFELLLAGAIIGVIGGHPKVMHFIQHLEGIDEPPPEDVGTAMTPCAPDAEGGPAQPGKAGLANPIRENI